MPPKKTLPSQKETLVSTDLAGLSPASIGPTEVAHVTNVLQKGQQNIASFFKGAAAGKRPVATSAKQASDAATTPANKALKVHNTAQSNKDSCQSIYRQQHKKALTECVCTGSLQI